MVGKTTDCPLCLVPYVSVRQHCLKLHQMFNRRELRLVMNYASGIHSGPLDCPICKCRGRVRLDKHLENVHEEIKREHYKGIVKAAKRRATLFALRYLRKSKPDPPMVSSLDLDNLSCSSEEEEEEEEEQGGQRPSSNDSGSSASASSPARECGKCGHLKQKVRHLEALLHSPTTTQMPQQTPVRPSPDTTTPSRKKYERVKTKNRGPTPQLGNVLNIWMKHISGSSKRQEENARQRLTHVRNWLIFMADGGIPAVTLPFLQNKERLIEWVNSLKKKHVVTTQLIQIGNVRSFLKFLIEAELPQVKVPKKHLHGTLFSLQTLSKMARKELQTHRQAVRLKKSSSLVNPANITAFITKANKEIPLALCTLDREKSREALERVYGLLSGIIACITGHRKGVISNLKVKEFAQAEEDELERRIIRVKEHKTKESFGHALIPLTKNEYMWFYRLIFNRHSYPCGKSELVFSNSNGGPFTDILTAFQNCWESFGFPGRPTFSMIRSSISTSVGRSLEDGKRGNVRRLMCHSTATAEKFYEADLGFNEAFQTREDTATALTNSFRNRFSYSNRSQEKSDTADQDNSVSQCTEEGGGADKDEGKGKRKKMAKTQGQDSDDDYTESGNSRSSQEEEVAHKGKKRAVKRVREQSDSEMQASINKDLTQAKRKKKTKRHGQDSDYTERSNNKSSQEEEGAHEGKKNAVKRARGQKDSEMIKRKKLTKAKRKKMSIRCLQVTDSDDMDSSESKSSQEEDKAHKNDSQTVTRKDITQAKRKMSKRHSQIIDYMETSHSESSEGEGAGDEEYVPQDSERQVRQGTVEERRKTHKQEEISKSGRQGHQIGKKRRPKQIDTNKDSKGKHKRVRQDKDNDTERPDKKVVEIISSSDEIENVRKTTGEPAQQTVKHDEAKKHPRLSCNPLTSPGKRNLFRKSPRAKYSYLQKKGKESPPVKPKSPWQSRLRSCQVLLHGINTKALEELKRQRKEKARKDLQEPTELIGWPEKHKMKNKTEMTIEEMTGNQKEDSHQVEARAGSIEKHPTDNAVLEKDRQVDPEDSAVPTGDSEGHPTESKLQNTDTEDSAAQGDKDSELVNCAVQAQDGEGDQEDSAEQTGIQEGDPEKGSVQLGHREENLEDCALQAGDRKVDPEDRAVKVGDKEGEPNGGERQTGFQEGEPEDGVAEAGDQRGVPDNGAVLVEERGSNLGNNAQQIQDQEEDPDNKAKQAGHHEGDQENGAVQEEDQKGGVEDCAKQANDQERDLEDSALQAGDRKGDLKDRAVKVGDKEGDPNDGARQTGFQEGEPENGTAEAGDQEGVPEDGAEQVGDKEQESENGTGQTEESKGDPENGTVQTGDSKGDPEDCAEQVGDKEQESENGTGQTEESKGDPENGTVQTGDSKGDPEDCAEQVGDKEQESENGTGQTEESKGDPENGTVQTGDSKGDPEDGATQARDTATPKPCFKLPRRSRPLNAETKRSLVVTKNSPSVTKKVLGKYQHLLKSSLKRKKRVQEYFSPPQLRVRKEKGQLKGK